VDQRIKASVRRYRLMCTALTKLASPLLESTWDKTLQPLLDEDVHTLTVAQVKGVSENQCMMSWIWRTTGMGDTLHLEWCKAHARAHHWQEECILLEEEMRCMEASFGWEINIWRGQASAAWGHSDGNQDGQAAYAFQQADIHMSMLAHCRHMWADAYALLHGNSVNGEPWL
ncbi:hypothetical protein L208DRAFT_1306445, partial [Tricholoma matsutake]